MARYIALGRIHPERADVNFEAIPGTRGDGASIKARCEASQVSVIIDDPNVEDPLNAHFNAELFARTIASSLGFALGTSYTVFETAALDALARAGAGTASFDVARLRAGTRRFAPRAPR